MVFGRSYHLIEYSNYLTIGLNPNANLKDVLWKSNGLRRFFLKFFLMHRRVAFFGGHGARLGWLLESRWRCSCLRRCQY